MLQKFTDLRFMKKYRVKGELRPLFLMATQVYIVVYRGDPMDFAKYRHTAFVFRVWRWDDGIDALLRPDGKDCPK
jgi:hypothetical protein